ncbi:hypothetical protein CKAH01_03572 [Colletotrichum kahawae]|uniref:Uncharacterized protein n=1 Tax=Colletotrichum kahawae TaxID=34407 RepID=A0AAD9YST2_COLKA|nr:hypothetical protein CKAH01_03572 [Colletotrichum kahawae]
MLTANGRRGLGAATTHPPSLASVPARPDSEERKAAVLRTARGFECGSLRELFSLPVEERLEMHARSINTVRVGQHLQPLPCARRPWLNVAIDAAIMLSVSALANRAENSEQQAGWSEFFCHSSKQVLWDSHSLGVAPEDFQQNPATSGS